MVDDRWYTYTLSHSKLPSYHAITHTTDTFPLVTHTGFQAPSRSHFCLPSAVIKFMQTPSSTSNNDHSESGSPAALNFGVRAVEGGGCRLSGFLKSCLTEQWRVKREIKVFSVCSNPTRETMFLTHSRKFFSARPTYNKTVISVLETTRTTKILTAPLPLAAT